MLAWTGTHLHRKGRSVEFPVSPIKRDVKRKTLLPAGERRNIFGHPAPDHTADTSWFAAARPYWPVAEQPHKPRSDGPAILLPRWGFMFLMTTPFGSLKLTSVTWLQSCQPWSYWRLVAYSFLRLSGGA